MENRLNEMPPPPPPSPLSFSLSSLPSPPPESDACRTQAGGLVSWLDLPCLALPYLARLPAPFPGEMLLTGSRYRTFSRGNRTFSPLLNPYCLVARRICRVPRDFLFPFRVVSSPRAPSLPSPLPFSPLFVLARPVTAITATRYSPARTMAVLCANARVARANSRAKKLNHAGCSELAAAPLG